MFNSNKNEKLSSLLTAFVSFIIVTQTTNTTILKIEQKFFKMYWHLRPLLDKNTQKNYIICEKERNNEIIKFSRVTC